MEILFTKLTERKKISEVLNGNCRFDFVEVISAKHLEVEPFDLKSKSLIFTSINGVESFFANGFKPKADFTKEKFNKIYAVGKKTKKELRKHGYETFKVKKHAQELAEFITANSAGEKFLHFCGNLALDVLDTTLPLQNIWYKKVVVYNTILLYPKVEKPFDAVVFFSPSGVRSFVEKNSLEGKKIFSIGYTTEKEISKHTDSQIFTSTESNIDDLLSLIKQECCGKKAAK